MQFLFMLLSALMPQFSAQSAKLDAPDAVQRQSLQLALVEAFSKVGVLYDPAISDDLLVLDPAPVSRTSFAPMSSYGHLIRVPADHPTVQAAVDAALDRDTIQLAGGFFADQHVTIDGRSLALVADLDQPVPRSTPLPSGTPRRTTAWFSPTSRWALGRRIHSRLKQ